MSNHRRFSDNAELQQLLVWRKDDTARVRELPAEEAMMWDEAMRGVSFARLCELVAMFDDPDTAFMRAARHLQGWIAAELLCKPECSNSAPKSAS